MGDFAYSRHILEVRPYMEVVNPWEVVSVRMGGCNEGNVQCRSVNLGVKGEVYKGAEIGAHG